MNQKLIYSQKNKFKEELVLYFDYIPDYELYELNDINELFNIDNKKLIEYVVNELNDTFSTTKGYNCNFDNVNYIFITHKDVLYHEIAHLLYRSKIVEFFEQQNEEKKHINFIDELVAEYISARLLGRSINLAEYIFRIKSGRRFDKGNIAYYFGGYLGLKPKDFIFPKDFVISAQNIEENITFENFKLVNINLNEIIKVIEKLKNCELIKV